MSVNVRIGSIVGVSNKRHSNLLPVTRKRYSVYHLLFSFRLDSLEIQTEKPTKTTDAERCCHHCHFVISLLYHRCYIIVISCVTTFSSFLRSKNCTKKTKRTKKMKKKKKKSDEIYLFAYIFCCLLSIFTLFLFPFLPIFLGMHFFLSTCHLNRWQKCRVCRKVWVFGVYDNKHFSFLFFLFQFKWKVEKKTRRIVS